MPLNSESANAAPVWQIGSFDNSPNEFNLYYSATPGNSPFNFTIGDPVNSFPGCIFGPDEDPGGDAQPNENNPLTIFYSLTTPEEYILKLDLYEMQNNIIGNALSFQILSNDSEVYSYTYSEWTDSGLSNDGSGPSLETDISIPVSSLNIGSNSLKITVSAGEWIAFDALALTPVPEPSVFIILGGGVINLLAYAWRRRKLAA
jgi:hypothetical protein